MSNANCKDDSDGPEVADDFDADEYAQEEAKLVAAREALDADQDAKFVAAHHALLALEESLGRNRSSAWQRPVANELRVQLDEAHAIMKKERIRQLAEGER